jgi:hypothetical protein
VAIAESCARGLGAAFLAREAAEEKDRPHSLCDLSLMGNRTFSHALVAVEGDCCQERRPHVIGSRSAFTSLLHDSEVTPTNCAFDPSATLSTIMCLCLETVSVLDFSHTSLRSTDQKKLRVCPVLVL